MRLKTYLTLHWLNSTIHDSRNPAQDYADLFDAGARIEINGHAVEDDGDELLKVGALTDSASEVFTKSGKQRVTRALRWLDANGFIALEPGNERRGRVPMVTLLSDLGDGTPFSPPDGGGDARHADRYFTIPRGMWINGWISALSGPALTVLLIYLDNRNPTSGKPAFVAGRRRAERYSVSEATMRRGSAELHAYGLATLDVRAKPRFNNSNRSFTQYKLHLERLDAQVGPREDCPDVIRGFRIHEIRKRPDPD